MLQQFGEHVNSKHTFIIEPVDPIDGSTFMISSEKEKVLWIADFVGQQKADCF